MNIFHQKMLKQVHKLNKVAFDYIIENIKTEYNKSIVEVSEMVGPIAAQSIGEPATQMTLNTFILLVFQVNQMLLVVFLVLRNCFIFQNQLNLHQQIYLDEMCRYDKAKANNVLNKIELTSLKDIVKSINIYFDPDESNTNVKDDKEILEIYKILKRWTLA